MTGRIIQNYFYWNTESKLNAFLQKPDNESLYANIFSNAQGGEMKVVAFNGSARKNENTAILVNHVFRELEKEGIETEMAFSADYSEIST